MLRQLRSVIRRVAPQAEEKLSYGMPYYSFGGRLVYFAAFRDHVSLFVMGKAQTAYPRETKQYRKTKATLHFPLGSRLPSALIAKLIRVRLVELASTKR